ncbi:hypothetical protein [Posidoniimonas corsicana]|nr:hypothetical protein [Posidoniimonas corsicana]
MYHDCRSEFEWFGHWLDIYVFNTTIKEWNQVLAALRQFEIRNEIDSKHANIPHPLDNDFFGRTSRDATYFRAFDYKGIQVNCHFFTDEEVEFDIDPREIVDQAALDDLIELLHLISDVTQKSVVLAPENAEGVTIVRVQPNSRCCDYRP